MVGAPFMGHPVPILGHRVVVQSFSNPIGAVQNTPNHHKCPPLPLCPYLRPHTQVLACPVIAWASPQAGAEEVGPKHTNTMSVTHLSARIPTACLVRPPPSLHTHPASLRVHSTPCVHTHQRGVSRSPACTLTNLRVYSRGVCRSTEFARPPRYMFPSLQERSPRSLHDRHPAHLPSCLDAQIPARSDISHTLMCARPPGASGITDLKSTTRRRRNILASI
jgi:hypothetical protein